MAQTPQYPPRICIALREDQMQDLNTLLPWGVKTRIYQQMTDDLIELLRVQPEFVIGGILSGKLRFTVEERDDGQSE